MIHIDLPGRKTVFASSSYWHTSHKLATVRVTGNLIGYTFAALLTYFIIFLLHVFTHVVQPIIFRKYTPGVITAVLVVLPYSLYGFHRLFNEELISGGVFSSSLLIGALLVVPIILCLRELGTVL